MLASVGEISFRRLSRPEIRNQTTANEDVSESSTCQSNESVQLLLHYDYDYYFYYYSLQASQTPSAMTLTRIHFTFVASLFKLFDFAMTDVLVANHMCQPHLNTFLSSLSLSLYDMYI
jgi:hypothetical protein